MRRVPDCRVASLHKGISPPPDSGPAQRPAPACHYGQSYWLPTLVNAIPFVFRAEEFARSRLNRRLPSRPFPPRRQPQQSATGYWWRFRWGRAYVEAIPRKGLNVRGLHSDDDAQQQSRQMGEADHGLGGWWPCLSCPKGSGSVSRALLTIGYAGITGSCSSGFPPLNRLAQGCADSHLPSNTLGVPLDSH